MAITSCSTCGTSNWRSSNIDHTGTLLTCANGHMNFEPGSGGGPVQTGSIRVDGQSAIGSGAVAIGNSGGKDKKEKKDKKGRR